MSRTARLYSIADQHFGGRDNVPVGVLQLVRFHKALRVSPTKFARQLKEHIADGDYPKDRDPHRESLRRHVAKQNFGLEDRDWYSTKKASTFEGTTSAWESFGKANRYVNELLFRKKDALTITRHSVARLTTRELEKVFGELDSNTIDRYAEYLKIISKSGKSVFFGNSGRKYWGIPPGAGLDGWINMLVKLANQVDPTRTHVVNFGDIIVEVKKGDTSQGVLAEYNKQCETKQQEAIRLETAAYHELVKLKGTPHRNMETLIADLTALATEYNPGSKTLKADIKCLAVETLTHPDEIALFWQWLDLNPETPEDRIEHFYSISDQMRDEIVAPGAKKIWEEEIDKLDKKNEEAHQKLIQLRGTNHRTIDQLINNLQELEDNKDNTASTSVILNGYIDMDPSLPVFGLLFQAVKTLTHPDEIELFINWLVNNPDGAQKNKEELIQYWNAVFRYARIGYLPCETVKFWNEGLYPLVSK